MIGELPIEHWYNIIGDPTLVDVILDRVIQDAHKIRLKGESMRKRMAKIQKKTEEQGESTRLSKEKEGNENQTSRCKSQLAYGLFPLSRLGRREVFIDHQSAQLRQVT